MYIYNLEICLIYYKSNNIYIFFFQYIYVFWCVRMVLSELLDLVLKNY